jgi:hypothetical protein
VLAFATGRIRSAENKPLQDYVGEARALTTNVGVVGWSAGGNRVIPAAASHGEKLSGVTWFASWESPVLSWIDGGWGSRFQPNPGYDPVSGTMNFERLRYTPAMPLWLWPILPVRWQPGWPTGGLYLDLDGNGRFNRDGDYAFRAGYRAVGGSGPAKAFYTLPVVREARARNVFGSTWPAHIATVEEVEERDRREDVLRRIPDAVRRLPDLAVLVFESETGHVTTAADHPHAIAHVNAWLDAGARWVRLNPDVSYVESVMGRPPSRAVQNPAGRRPAREDHVRRVGRGHVLHAAVPERRQVEARPQRLAAEPPQRHGDVQLRVARPARPSHGPFSAPGVARARSAARGRRGAARAHVAERCGGARPSPLRRRAG